MLNNFEFSTLKTLRKITYEIFSKLCKTNPIFYIFRLKTMIDPKNKPNSNPKAKTYAFSRIMNFKIIFSDFLAEFTTLKGANFNFSCRKITRKSTILREQRKT